MKKKALLSLLATGFLASALVGCSKPETKEPVKNQTPEKEPVADEQVNPEKDAKLLLWDNGDAEGEWAKYVAEEFTKKYNIPVEVAEVGHTDAPGKLKTDGPAGLGADVFAAAHDHVGTMASAGLINENFFPNEYGDRLMDAAKNGTSYDEVLYGYPTAIETYALYYNKDLVKEVPETMDELVKQSKEFTDTKAQKYGFMMEPGNFYYTYAFLGGYGGYVFGDNNTDPSKLGLNSEGAVKSADFMKKLNKEVLPLKKEDITGDVISGLFNENKLMYRISGPWDIKNHQDAGINFGVAPLPELDNGKSPTSFSGIKGYYVNAYSKFPNAASLLAQFATSDEMLEKRFEMTGQLPPSTALLDSEAIKKDEIASAFLEQATKAVPMPNIPEMQSVWGPMETAYTAVWNTDIDSKKALDDAVKQVEDAIKTQQK